MLTLGEIITKEFIDIGPIPNSKWMELHSRDTLRVLKITSEPEHFPPKAKEEIRNERGDRTFELPSCQVDIVLGVQDKQAIYVVLPTHVHPEIPFSVNAPFLQDPARTGIKDPITSPTNEWLLNRIGRLVATSIESWLSNSSMKLDERIRAYSLLPHPKLEGQSLETDTKKVIVDSIRNYIGNTDILLSSSGKMTNQKDCLDIPPELLNVWKPEVILNLFDKEKKHVIAQEISSWTRKSLSKWGWLSITQPVNIILRLAQEPYPPRPKLDDLCFLWEYTENYYQWGWRREYGREFDDFAIVPIQGRKLLHPRKSALVLSRKEKKLTRSDWNFLCRHVLVVDPKWIEYVKNIIDLVYSEDENEDYYEDNYTEKSTDESHLQATMEIFDRFDLGRGVSIQSIYKQASDRIFSRAMIDNKVIQLAYIAARLGLEVPDTFKYLCKDGSLRSISNGLLGSEVGELTDLIPEPYLLKTSISDQYKDTIDPDSVSLWENWASSPASKLNCFPLPLLQAGEITGKDELEQFCRQHGGYPPDNYPLLSERFTYKDYDFEVALWEYWEECASGDSWHWVKLVKSILDDWKEIRKQTGFVTVVQPGKTIEHTLECGTTLATWIMRLKSLSCMLDVNSKPKFPSTLYRLTAETAPLDRIENFIHPDFDKPVFHEFLDLLGVQSTPADVYQLLDRLRSTASQKEYTLQEIINLYDAIDRMLYRLSRHDKQDVIITFENENLILTEGGTWHKKADVFKSNDDAFPNAHVLLKQSNYLRLWDYLGIPIRPQVDFLIDWLNNLPVGMALRKADLKLTRNYLCREPRLIWENCAHWLDLESRWISAEDLTYKVYTPFEGFSFLPWISQITADLSMLDPNIIDTGIFKDLQNLNEAITFKIIELRVVDELPKPPPWLLTLSKNLICTQRSIDGDELGDETDWKNVHAVAGELLNTRWQYVNSITLMPYVGDQLAGDEKTEKALWQDEFLYVLADGANHHRELVNAISSRFDSPVIQQIISGCIDRSPEWIVNYFREYYVQDETLYKLPMFDDSELSESKKDGTEIEPQDDLETVRSEHPKTSRRSSTTRKGSKKRHKISDRDHRSIGDANPEIEEIAMSEVMDSELELGYHPEDVSKLNRGWDIESHDPRTGYTRLIEVKGRIEGASSVIVSRNEIISGLARRDQYYLVVVEVEVKGKVAKATEIHYIQFPFHSKPDVAATHVVYDWKELSGL